jgi:hypothetical protein
MVKRDRMLNIRLSSTEFDLLVELADELETSQSGLVRQLIRLEHERHFGRTRRGGCRGSESS